MILLRPKSTILALASLSPTTPAKAKPFIIWKCGKQDVKVLELSGHFVLNKTNLAMVKNMTSETSLNTIPADKSSLIQVLEHFIIYTSPR